MPEISIIVPVFNVEPYLRCCVDSILSQSFEDYELILVDDGSPDNCGLMCDEYAEKDSRVLALHQGNTGVSAARNKGKEHARGEYILFVDADDILPHHCLSELYSLMVKLNADIVFGNKMKFVSANSMQFAATRCEESAILSKRDFLNCGQERRLVTGHLIRREIIRNIDFDENVSLGEDAIFNYMVLLKCPNIRIVMYKGILYYWRMRANSACHSKGGNLGFCTIGEWCLEKYWESQSQEIDIYISDLLLLEALKELMLFRYQGFTDKEIIQTCKKQLERGALYLLGNPRLSVKNKVCYLVLVEIPLSYSIMRWLRDKLNM